MLAEHTFDSGIFARGNTWLYFLELWSPNSQDLPSINLQDLALHAGVNVKPMHLMAQLKQQLVEVWAEFEETRHCQQVIDQWRKQLRACTSQHSDTCSEL